MESIKEELKNLIQVAASKSALYNRNLLKDYLQILVLDFIYSHPHYSDLVFYGGSSLAQCYGLPRLSENLDFVDLKKKIDIVKLKVDLESFFKTKYDFSVKATAQKFRVYLKFPILHELGLASKSESNLLFLKVEVFSEFNFCKKHKIEILPLFKYNKSILIKSFDLSTLMATKIRAIFNRQWKKTSKQGNDSIIVKGRDYFDLMWYLEKGIAPNITCIENVKNITELKKMLLDNIRKADAKSIELDLEALIDDAGYIKNVSKNMKNILENLINSKLENTDLA
ncbi:MAG: hypothetical protein ACD_11C00006G0010 [uncultured bacterium]|nr:MAG: hypothetical protein ACD_11C00006G0010 [uncultured bacterium]HBR71690.1 hypothetical protein [Candidatus Moranbacteria bacterium]